MNPSYFTSEVLIWLIEIFYKSLMFVISYTEAPSNMKFFVSITFPFLFTFLSYMTESEHHCCQKKQQLSRKSRQLQILVASCFLLLPYCVTCRNLQSFSRFAKTTLIPSLTRPTVCVLYNYMYKYTKHMAKISSKYNIVFAVPKHKQMAVGKQR